MFLVAFGANQVADDRGGRSSGKSVMRHSSRQMLDDCTTQNVICQHSIPHVRESVIMHEHIQLSDHRIRLELAIFEPKSMFQLTAGTSEND